MALFHIYGYNSGGYEDKVKIHFDGDIEKFYKKVMDGEREETQVWYKYKYKDRRIVEDRGALLEQMMREVRNEAFLPYRVKKRSN